jgi:alanyl-tRNA synthetase
MSRAEATVLGVTAPDEAGDTVRVVDAEGFDRQACGGTHPCNTSEVGVIVALGHERHKGGTRIRFVCGARAVAALHHRQAVVDEASAILSAAPEALPAALRRLAETAADADKRCRLLQDQAIEALAARIAAGAPPGDPAIIAASFEGYAPADLRALAAQVAAQRAAIVLLGSRHAGRAHLAFARTPGRAEDLGPPLRAALEIVGGRGGGRGDLVQGGGDRMQRVDDALAAAAAMVRG